MAKTDNEIVNNISTALEQRKAYRGLLETLVKSDDKSVSKGTKAFIREKLREIKAK